MRRRMFAFVVALAIITSTVVFAQTSPQPATVSHYLMPPKEIVEAFDVAPLPQAILSPSKQVLALLSRKANPTIAELAQPILRLAGARVNPKTNGPQRTAGIYSITLKKLADSTEIKVSVPPQANLSGVHFSPDGAHLSFLNTKEDGIELWIADVITGKAKMISAADRPNATTGDPCDWLRDNVTLICTFVPPGRGPAPLEPTVPTGPNVQENTGKAAPAATFEDMIKTAHDEAVFEFYFTSQLVAINSASGKKTAIGGPAIFGSVTPSPNGDYILVSRVKRPFSHLIPLGGFPE